MSICIRRAVPVRLTSREGMADLVMRFEQAGAGHLVPLVRAASAGALCFTLTTKGDPVEERFLNLPQPTVVVLGADHAGAFGPEGWPQATGLLRWAHRAVIHAAAGQPEHYALIAQAAVRFRRVLVIECEGNQAGSWRELAQEVAPKLPVLNILPKPGEVHPRLSVPAGTVLQ